MHALLAHLSHNMTQPYFSHSEFRLVHIMEIYYESRHLDFLDSSSNALSLLASFPMSSLFRVAVDACLGVHSLCSKYIVLTSETILELSNNIRPN